jgi:hypothetical protein
MLKHLTNRRILIGLALGLVLVVGIRNFYLPPELSRSFSHVPDSVENTLAMKNLMNGRGFTIRLNGVYYPSRYQPWFSLLFVAPALYFSGGNVLCSYYGCFAAGIVALAAAFLLGRKLGGGACGVLLAAVLCIIPSFARYTNVAMTEVPYTVLLVFAAGAWLDICTRREMKIGGQLLFGVLCALAGALRSTALVLPIIILLPLWKKRPGKTRLLAALAATCGPAAAVAAANAVYNKAVFGKFFRSGYHYWDPVDYDYFGNTFALRFFFANLKSYSNTANLCFILLPLLAAVAALVVLRRRKREAFEKLGALTVFAAALAGISFSLYLPYFSYQEERFFVPVQALACLCGAAAAGMTVTAHLRQHGEAVLGATALILMLVPWPSPYAKQIEHDELRSAKIALLANMHENLPENAVLLTIFQQGAAEYFFVGDGNRRIIPFFRCYEYAQMVTAKHRIDAPPNGLDPRDSEPAQRYLAEHGAVRPYPLVYTEAPEEVDRLIDSGVPVYVSDYTLLIHPPARELARHYRPVEAGAWNGFRVYRLLPPGGMLSEATETPLFRAL